MARYYPAIVEPAANGFGVFFPDVPGCTSAGATVQEAARNAGEALPAHLDLAAEHGEAIPEPSELDAIKAESDVVEAARVLVRVETPGRSVRGARTDAGRSASCMSLTAGGRAGGVPLPPGWAWAKPGELGLPRNYYVSGLLVRRDGIVPLAVEIVTRDVSRQILRRRFAPDIIINWITG